VLRSPAARRSGGRRPLGARRVSPGRREEGDGEGKGRRRREGAAADRTWRGGGGWRGGVGAATAGGRENLELWYHVGLNRIE
jgi:hypothetical protein